MRPQRSVLRRIAFGRLASWLAVGVIALAIAVLGGTKLVGVAAQPNGPIDPSAACARAGGRCDPAAEAARAAENVEAQPPTGVTLSRSDVEARARRLALTPLTPEAPASAIVYSALMTRPAYEALAHEARNYAVDVTRMVWVVTVHADMATDGTPGGAPKIFHVYSAAIDAETGQWTDYCVGCDWLPSSR
ncbi:MAG: hypothetical protein ACM3SX_23255 [Deltaproteobacteria bacterium]